MESDVTRRKPQYVEVAGRQGTFNASMSGRNMSRQHYTIRTMAPAVLSTCIPAILAGASSATLGNGRSKVRVGQLVTVYDQALHNHARIHHPNFERMHAR